MSSLMRNTRRGNEVVIGDVMCDLEKESAAERKLGGLFPIVTVMTHADGSKSIPIQEIYKIEDAYYRDREADYQKGLKEGYEKGHAEGLAIGKAQAAKVLKDFDQAIKQVVGQRHALLEEAKQQVLQLVIQISKKVTYGAFEADPEVTIKLISGVIDSLNDRSQMKIKVNPNHLPVVEQHIDTFMENSTSIKDIEILPDPRVKYGGCFIETPSGDIDARLESQFEIVENTIAAEED